MKNPAPSVLYQRARATRTRAEILAVAVDLASAEGLEGLTIGRLAIASHMSKTGIFAHFGSKQQLQLATVGAAKQIFLEQIVKPGLASPRGLPRLKVMLESWLGYVERIVFRGGCFFAAASLEFDSRPGKVRDEIASLTKAWLMALQREIAFARIKKQIKTSVVPSQLAFELHAYVQEANWAFKLFDDKSAFLRARRAISERLAEGSAQ
ncbi:MAG: TetR/AcrR family transcriptional regulator [Acidobacteria bacterium]|nr:MAG: TetR/AcrR family transcriptional regulator [Acidobacteriota bacterium]